MNRRNFFTTMLATIATLLVVGFTAGANHAQAQSQPPGPCPVYWINYNYVYPPAPSGAFTISIECADGRIISVTRETADGHYTYPSDPSCNPIAAWIEYVDPGTGTIVRVRAAFVPGGGPTVVPTPWGPFRVEGKFDHNGCFELDLSY